MPLKNYPTAPSNVSSAVRDYLAANGRKGGSATSERKSKAARRNAKKGGWPKGRPRKHIAERKKVVAGGVRNATKRSGAGSQNK